MNPHHPIKLNLRVECSDTVTFQMIGFLVCFFFVFSGNIQNQRKRRGSENIRCSPESRLQVNRSVLKKKHVLVIDLDVSIERAVSCLNFVIFGIYTHVHTCTYRYMFFFIFTFFKREGLFTSKSHSLPLSSKE